MQADFAIYGENYVRFGDFFLICSEKNLTRFKISGVIKKFPSFQKWYRADILYANTLNPRPTFP